MSSKKIMRDGHIVDAEIKLPLMDRIRLIFGSRMWFQMQIATPWKTDIETKSSVIIEKAFRRRRVEKKIEPVS